MKSVIIGPERFVQQNFGPGRLPAFPVQKRGASPGAAPRVQGRPDLPCVPLWQARHLCVLELQTASTGKSSPRWLQNEAARKYVDQHGGDESFFFDESNLQGECKPCHDATTARECGFAPQAATPGAARNA
jgi:hypothetical protein